MIILGIIAILEPFLLSYMTNKLIEKEDERAKRMIDEGNKRLEKILLKIDESTKDILAEIIKRV